MLYLDQKYVFLVPPGLVSYGQKWLQKAFFLKYLNQYLAVEHFDFSDINQSANNT